MKHFFFLLCLDSLGIKHFKIGVYFLFFILIYEYFSCLRLLFFSFRSFDIYNFFFFLKMSMFEIDAMFLLYFLNRVHYIYWPMCSLAEFKPRSPFVGETSLIQHPLDSITAQQGCFLSCVCVFSKSRDTALNFCVEVPGCYTFIQDRTHVY